MDQLKKLFASLSLAQKIGLGLVILLIGMGVPAFTHWQREAGFKPLFTGMAPEDAGAVVAKIKESGTEYRLAENGTTVLVPSDKVSEVRLELAGAGLPKSGRIGFEIFDDKSNMLNATDFLNNVNYRRAIEGELERTIKSINDIEQARVHISFPKDSVFEDSRQPAKASVLLHVTPGAHLQPQNVTAVANLVASAVEGLSPDSVAIADTQGNLLNHRRKPSADASETAENALEYKSQVEKDLTAKVEDTLEPLLGEGRFRVGITADCDFSTSEQTDEIYDSTRSAVATSKKSEDSSQGAGAGGGPPGTASNLPRSQIKAQSGGPTGGSGSSLSRRTEDVTFDPTRTVRHVNVPRGTIKKISAAVLIDQEVQWQGKGKDRKRVFTPPSPERLNMIKQIVSGIIGISSDRGDQLIVESGLFEQTRNADEPVTDVTKSGPGKLTVQDLLANKKILIGVGAGLVFIVLLLFFIMRRPKAAPVSAQLMDKPSLAAGASRSSESHGISAPDQHGETSAEKSARQVEGNGVAGAESDGIKELEEAMPHLKLPAMTSHTKILLDHLRKTVAKDPDGAANVIRSWMEEA